MNKRIFSLILITVLLSVILTGCRFKYGDYEIICDDNGECTETGSIEWNDQSGYNPPYEEENMSNKDFATRIVEIAQSYLPYSREDFMPVAAKHGFEIKYYPESDKYTAWCSIFVSSVVEEANKGLNWMNYKSASVSGFMSQMIKDGRFYHAPHWYNYNNLHMYDPSSFGAPRAGDIVFFAVEECGYAGDGKMPARSDEKKCWRHIGIVTGSDDKYLYYIHGNNNGCKHDGVRKNGVCTGKKELTDRYIIGYGR